VSLRQQVLSGLFWTGGGRLLGQIVNWSITLVVIRLLSPADYGLLAMATLFLSFLLMFAEAGLGPALVQARELDETMLRSTLGAVIVIDCALFLILVAAAPVIAGFFEEPRLVSIIRVLAVQILLSMFGTIPTAMLSRALDFKRPSIVGLASSVLGSLTTLALALAGYGVWALVVGNLAAQVCSVAALNALSPFARWPDFSMKGARTLIDFGWRVTTGRTLWFLYSQADIVIAGKLLGKELLGVYSVSMHLASLPVQKVSSILNQVAFPAFASLRENRAAVAANLLKTIRLVGFVGFPITWGLASVSQEAVHVLLGEKWEGATVPLRLIALVMPFRILSTLLPSATDGIGRADVAMTNVFVACLVMPLAFFIGCQWGIVGLSIAWVVAYPLVVLQNVHRTAQAIDMSMGSVWSAAARPLAASAMIYAGVTALRTALPPALPEATKLSVLISCGFVIYIAVSWVVNRSGIAELRDLIRAH
jgi:O-antigen/teichoic acid export membrane protein